MITIEIAKDRNRQNRGKKQKRTTNAPLLSRELSFFKPAFGSKYKEHLYTELGILLAAGLDINLALEIIEEEFAKQHQPIIKNIKMAVINGHTLSEAMRCSSGTFSSFEYESVKIGEETGRLSSVFLELGEYFRAAARLRRQISSVLTYPIIVITLATAVVYFMLCIVVPVFSELFSQTGRKLPAITELLLTMSGHAPLAFGTMIGLCTFLIIIHNTQRRKSWYRTMTSSFIMRIPVVGKLVVRIYLARFCQAMKLLVGARVMMNDSLQLVKKMIGFYPMELALDIVQADVIQKGKLLNESLAAIKIFPKKLVAMIRLAEEVNEPQLIFERLHQQYTSEVEHQQQLIGKLIEPFIIVILGLFVGLILVALYLPMFEMSSGTF